MIYEVLPFSEKNPNVTLTTYVFDDKADNVPSPRRAVIVCPGGGYRFLSEREAEPIVARFLGAGFNVFLLRYSIAPMTENYNPLTEAGRAIAYVRTNAERYHTDPDKIFICGFSAGGHLAASAGILWDCEQMKKEFEGQPEGINRPNGMVLSYPVITAGQYAHQNSIRHLTGNHQYGEKEIAEWSLEKRVSSSTVPAFIWHTVTDEIVPVQNSIMLAEALAKNKIPFELHIYPYGPHGLSLATEETANGKENKVVSHVQNWIDHAITWIKLMS